MQKNKYKPFKKKIIKKKKKNKKKDTQKNFLKDNCQWHAAQIFQKI